MPRSVMFVAVLLAGALSPRLYAQDPPSSQSAPTVRAVTIVGAKELSTEAITTAAHVHVGEPMPGTVERLAESVVQRYRDDGYTFARATATFDEATGTLTLTIDEGVIGRIAFEGVEESLARRLAADFALRAGDVFNRDRARQALDALLQPTRGAVRPSHLHWTSTDVSDSRQLTPRQGVFDMRDENGERVLFIGLREPAGRFKLVPDFGDREDWFSSVDGFAPSIGFGAAVFDHKSFNHSYVAGHFSYRFASESVGYTLGFERPFFGTPKLFVGGEVYDLTATEDNWRVTPLEASLFAIGPRESYHDYYRRRGIQINAALRVHPRVELLFAWRDERQEPLSVQSDFSLWNSDDAFRPNLVARDGRLRALVVGASVDGEGFDRESLDASYRRHQLETPFGARLNAVDSRAPAPVWRLDWTSEISAPDAFGSDFDFRRHIVTGRAVVPLSPHQDFGARAIGGWSEGVLPPQREFAVGGIGSVHGYEFKEEVGDAMALVNLEYALGWRRAFQVIGFFDVGRATAPRIVEPPWLKGIGFGFAAGDVIRIDFGYKLDAIPSSLQVLVRFSRSF